MKIDFNFTKKQSQAVVFFGIFCLAIFYIITQNISHNELKNAKIQTEQSEILQPPVIIPSPFDNLTLSAQAYYVWDMKEKKAIASFNEEMQLPLASLTKLMTVLVASEIVANDVVITVKDENVDNDGNNRLIAGEKWCLPDMINFILMASSNDGACALASAISAFDENISRENFVEAMNKKAEELGMTQTFFLNVSGLDMNQSIGGAYGSAKDTAILLENILTKNPSLLEASVYKEMRINSDMFSRQVNNTNQIVDKLPGLVASKTGWTDLAQGNLMVAFDIGMGHNIIISVLGSTKEGRFSDMEQLVWASIKNNSSKNENAKVGLAY
ncbi:MAG: hypothetical protein ABIG87_02670 [Patescibacteria group bacterium]